MFTQNRKQMALAASLAMLLTLAGCAESQSGEGSTEVTRGQPLLQIAGDGGVYSAEQDREYRAAGGDPDKPMSDDPEPVISAATEKTFEIPEEVEPGVYLFEPDGTGDGLFYVSKGFGKLPNVISAPSLMIVELTPEMSSFSMGWGALYEPTASQIESLPHADLSR